MTKLEEIKRKLAEVQMMINALEASPKKSSPEEVVDMIIGACTEFHGITPLNRATNRKVAKSRQRCHYFARMYTDLSREKIGRRVGGQHAATVLHSERMVRVYSAQDQRYQRELEELNNLILSKLK